MKLRKLVAVIASAAVASAMAVSASAMTAGLGFQTGTYGFRNNPWQSDAIWWNNNEEDSYATWKVVDADVTKDGQYTVSFEKSDDDGATSWNFLHLYFMAPSEDYPDLKVTIDSFKVDGKEIEGAKAAVVGAGDSIRADDYTTEVEAGTLIKDALTVTFFNTYGEKENNVIASSDYGQKVEVTFTVSGMGGGDSAPSTEAPAEGTAAAGDTTKPVDDKTSPNTGVEGVAVVAGIAVIATGAIVVAKKRK